MSADLHKLLAETAAINEPRTMQLFSAGSGGALVLSCLAATLTGQNLWWLLALIALLSLAITTGVIFATGMRARARFVSRAAEAGVSRETAASYWDGFDWKDHRRGRGQ